MHKMVFAKINFENQVLKMAEIILCIITTI